MNVPADVSLLERELALAKRQQSTAETRVHELEAALQAIRHEEEEGKDGRAAKNCLEQSECEGYTL